MRPNAFQKILSLIYLFLLAVCCIFYVPFRGIHTRYDTKIVYDAIWSDNSNIDFYRVFFSLLILTVVFYFWYRYLDTMNDLESSIYKKKAKTELKIFIVFISALFVCLVFLIGTNIINQQRSDSLETDIKNTQNLIKKEAANSRENNSDLSRNQKYKITQQTLADFTATILAKPNLTSVEIFKKFPEFNNNPKLLQSALDYSTTLESGKYKTIEELNSKFPEFDFSSVTDSNKADKLYKNLLNDGYTFNKLGTEQEFVKKISDSAYASDFYDFLISEGYTERNLGTKNEFLSTFVIVKGSDEIQKEQRMKTLTAKMDSYNNQKNSLSFYQIDEIKTIMLIWFVVLFSLFYIGRPLFLFVKGIFSDLK